MIPVCSVSTLLNLWTAGWQCAGCVQGERAYDALWQGAHKHEELKPMEVLATTSNTFCEETLPV